MTRTHSQEATRPTATPQCATLDMGTGHLIDIETLLSAALRALEAYGLAPQQPAETRFDGLEIDAGPIGLAMRIDDGSENNDGSARLYLHVENIRRSETLHPRADTAILAEILSILIEDGLSGQIAWGKEGIGFDTLRFAEVFTPIRHNNGIERHITPRRPARIALDDHADEMIFAVPSAPAPTIDTPDLREIFRDAMDEDEVRTPSDLSRAANLTATASLTVMNPMVGLPVAAYQALKGQDIRISAHAFTLTAIYTGLAPTMVSYLSVL
ncbi:hypothetical protein [Pseudooceanicola nitratireducens]|uniref:hypothetical protein n=1 Tax=Pseudooceanicola nitratireducens TaxID=517719 RepID=UPI0023F533D8|nr:hypothetical protein [Pseudooceanicola nitratireducens]